MVKVMFQEKFFFERIGSKTWNIGNWKSYGHLTANSTRFCDHGWKYRDVSSARNDTRLSSFVSEIGVTDVSSTSKDKPVGHPLLTSHVRIATRWPDEHCENRFAFRGPWMWDSSARIPTGLVLVTCYRCFYLHAPQIDTDQSSQFVTLPRRRASETCFDAGVERSPGWKFFTCRGISLTIFVRILSDYNGIITLDYETGETTDYRKIWLQPLL